MKNNNEKKEYSLIICDDDEDQAIQLGNLIEESFENFNIYICSEVKIMIDYIINHDIDAVLLDISLNDTDGIKVSKYLKTIQPDLKIIFVSGYPEYIHDIFEVDPTFFLLKPVTEEKLQKAFKFAFFKHETKKDALEISYKGKVTLVNYDEILFIESNKRIVYVHCIDKSQHRMYRKLAELEMTLSEEFVRCHQSYIVNMAHVKSFNTTNFELRSDEVIPISQGKSRKTKESFYSYLKNKH